MQLLRFHPPSRSLLSSVFSFSSKSDIKEEEKEEKATEKGEEEGEKRTDNEAFALCVMEGWCGKGKEVEVSEWICEIMGNSEKVEDLARFLEKWKKAVNLGRYFSFPFYLPSPSLRLFSLFLSSFSMLIFFFFFVEYLEFFT